MQNSLLNTIRQTEETSPRKPLNHDVNLQSDNPTASTTQRCPGKRPEHDSSLEPQWRGTRPTAVFFLKNTCPGLVKYTAHQGPLPTRKGSVKETLASGLCQEGLPWGQNAVSGQCEVSRPAAVQKVSTTA